MQGKGERSAGAKHPLPEVTKESIQPRLLGEMLQGVEGADRQIAAAGELDGLHLPVHPAEVFNALSPRPFLGEAELLQGVVHTVNRRPGSVAGEGDRNPPGTAGEVTDRRPAALPAGACPAALPAGADSYAERCGEIGIETDIFDKADVDEVVPAGVAVEPRHKPFLSRSSIRASYATGREKRYP